MKFFFKRSQWLLLTIFIIIFFLRLQKAGPTNFSPNLTSSNLTIKVSGVISQEPTAKNGTTSFKVGDFSVYINNFNLKSPLRYGDYLVLIGKPKIKVINRFYQLIVLNNPEIIEVRQEKEISYSWQFGYRIASKLGRQLDRVLPEPHSSLLNGILLGQKRDFPKPFWQALKKTGTLHIVVASGANLVFVTHGLQWLLWQSLKVHRKLSLLIILFFTFIYMFIVGFEPPIVRAGIMAILALVASLSGRQATGWWFLILSAGLMLLIKPLLLFNLSFQLTVAATTGLLLLGPKAINKKARFILNAWNGIKGEVQTAIACFVFTAPVLYWQFREMTIKGIIVNPLVNWLVPYIMILGTILLILSFIWWPLALLFQPFCWLMLEYFVRVIGLFSKL